MATGLATVSRQPRLPQRQISPRSCATTWPISPATPRTPWYGLPAEDQPGADARREADVGEVVDAARRAEHALAERAGVGVVLELDRDAEPRLHLRRRADAVPAGEDPVGVELAAAPVDRRRQAHADAEHAILLDPGVARARCGRARARGRGSRSARGRPRRATSRRRPGAPTDRRPRCGCAGGRGRGRPRSRRSARATGGSAGARCCAGAPRRRRAPRRRPRDRARRRATRSSPARRR